MEQITSQEAYKILSCLRRLVNKIDGERARGTPLRPAGYSDCDWDDDYPQELINARCILEEYSDLKYFI